MATSCRCQMRGGDAFREHFATGERPGTHRGDILASPRCSGIHSVDMLPRPGAAGEGRSGAQRYLRGVGPNRWKSTRLKSAALSTRESGLESLACVWASARNTFYASMRPFACASVREVGVSLSRSLIAGNGFESALFRWATMSPLRVPRSCAVSCAEAKCALTFMSGAANVVEGMSWAFARQWEIWQAL